MLNSFFEAALVSKIDVLKLPSCTLQLFGRSVKLGTHFAKILRIRWNLN